jgi:anti-anti-sigma regulatory factor
MNPDDQVLIYTDGLLDVSGGEKTAEDIAETLKPLKDHAHPLEQLFRGLTGGQIRQDCDDVTMVLLSATPGTSEFDESLDTLDLTTMPADEQPSVSYAETSDATVFVITGRMIWLYGQTLYDAALAAIDAGRDIVIDLGRCEHMDSTLLGTLHELTLCAEKAGRKLTFQNVPQPLMESFEELSMKGVLNHIGTEPINLPDQLTVMDLRATHGSRQQQRLLKAHEILAELSDDNREQFGGLVATLRSELGEAGS